MLSIAPAVADSSYYQDSKNYYDADALGEPVWFGKAADDLGLTGPVDGRVFDQICKGEMPDGTILGRGSGDLREHRPGWDLTFSSPKSVSIMALVAGDRRLIAAVNRAAKEAMTWIEETAARSRFTLDGRTVSRSTGNLAAAMFTHDLTRAQEPGLHVHAVIMNATQAPDGAWRSLDSRFFYWLAKEGGLRFQQSLASLTRKLGHEIEVDTTKGTFEIAGIPRALIEAYSTRSKQIIANLTAKGLDRETATTLERKAAAVETRAAKEPNVDSAAKARAWRQVSREHGVDLQALMTVAGARPGSTESDPGQQNQITDDALKAARTAAQILAEKQTVFSDIKLLDRAAIHAMGRADRRVLRSAIRQLDKEGFLQAREVPHFDRVAGEHIRVQGWTTADAIAIERGVLESESEGRFTQRALLSFRAANRVVDQAAKDGGQWERDHRLALVGLLTTQNRVVAVEGSMERAANKHVVETYLDVARRRGFVVQVMTPSTAEAAALSSLIARPVTTVAEHLGALWRARQERREHRRPYLGPSFPRIPTPSSTQQVWLVADAARLQPSTARNLLKAATYNNARVVLMDEVRDGPSFASRAFEQLRKSGMTKFQLPEHHEQNRNELHLAVAALARGEPAIALDHIEKAGGQIIAIGAPSRSIADQNAALQQRRDYIANRYASLDSDQRSKTRVLDLTHRGKEAINAAIRQSLVDRGELSGPTLKVDILIAKSMTPTERKQAVSYRPGDVIRFSSAHRQTAGRPAIARGDYFTVQDVQSDTGNVTLQSGDGRPIVWELERWGARSASAYRTDERELAAGERIVWTRTDRTIGIKAGQRDTIVNVHPESATISIERGGMVMDIDVTKARHLELAYADTVSRRVRTDHVIAHMPVDNVELTNLKALTDVALQSRQLTIVTENAARLAQAAEDRTGKAQSALDGPSSLSGAALDAVRTAADILVERNSVFPDKDLKILADKQGLGHVEREQAHAAIKALVDTGQLIRRETEVLDLETGELIPAAGWTTLDATQDEEKMLAAEGRGRYIFADNPILSKVDAARLVGHLADHSPSDRAWNPEQWTSAVGLLSSPHRVTGLQGLAGTAKTSTVLAALAYAAKGAGHEVSAMAPTTDAALTLGNQLRTDEGRTVARHLSQVNRVRPAGTEKAPVWIVDEASMVSAKTMRDLIRTAEQHDARLFLVFDVLQLGSVGAGRAAGQLIENGMTTHYLDRIVRQAGNPRMREAVYDMIRRDPARALGNLVTAGGTLLGIDADDRNHRTGEWFRHQAMAKEFVSRSAEFRKETMVIDPTREGVAAVSEAIREALNKNGELSGEPITITILEDANLTRPERATSTSYRQGQIVRFPQPTTLGNASIQRDAYLEVAGIEGAEIKLRDDDGKLHRWEPRTKSLPVEVYDTRTQELQIGDRIRWTRNNDQIKAISGRSAVVVAIDEANQSIEIEHQDGGRHRLDLTRRDQQHFGQGYAVTAQRAQGATAHPIVNLPSWRSYTVNSAVGYVMMSRTHNTAFVVTDSRHKLIEALKSRDGQQAAAMDQVRETAGLAEQKVREMATNREHSRDIGGPALER